MLIMLHLFLTPWLVFWKTKLGEWQSHTHMCHSNAGAEADVSPRLHSMQLGQYPGRIRSQCRQHFTVAAERHTVISLTYFLHASATIHTHIAIHSSYFAMVIRPTLFSGLLRVLVWQTTFTASCWAWSLVGRKSPFRIYSLLSTLGKINSSVNNHQFSKHVDKTKFKTVCRYTSIFIC